jgi:hypothetical protein
VFENTVLRRIFMCKNEEYDEMRSFITDSLHPLLSG